MIRWIERIATVVSVLIMILSVSSLATAEELLWEFNKDGKTEGWRARGCVYSVDCAEEIPDKELSVKDGILRITKPGKKGDFLPEVSIVSPDVNLEAKLFDKVEFKIRVPKGVKYFPMMYWLTPVIPDHQERSGENRPPNFVQGDQREGTGDWEIRSFSGFSTFKSWQDTLIRVNLKFVFSGEQVEYQIEIDYIKLYKSTPVQPLSPDELLWEFNKDDDTEGWTAFNPLYRKMLDEKLSVKDGILTITMQEKDERESLSIVSPDLNKEAKLFDKVEFKIRVPKGVKYSPQMQWLTSVISDKSEDYARGDQREGTGDWEIRSFSGFSTYKSWQGNLIRLYLNFFLSTELKQVEIDYIKLYKSTPTVTTNPATNVRTTSVILNGSVNPNGLSTTVKFQWGKTISYGNEVVGTPSPLTGTSPVSVRAVLTVLTPGTTYNYRVVATNSGGTTHGGNQSFVTLLLPPTLASPSNGAVNKPQTLTLSWNASNGAVTYRLQVSKSSVFTTTVYDDSTLTSTSKQVGPLDTVTVYYWRVKAKNAGGTSVWSSVWSFTTGSVSTVEPPETQQPPSEQPSEGTTSYQPSGGYSTLPNKIVVNRREHWAKWKYPGSAVTIDEYGRITPSYIRKNINAVQDASKFTHPLEEDTKISVKGGIKDAGSNLKDARNIIDGDPTTFWEPFGTDPIKDGWWVKIDLGRVVVATKIVLKFVDKELGDPFYKFKVLTSIGKMEKPFGGEPYMYFDIAFEQLDPNFDKREFEIELKPPATGTYPDLWSGGDPIQYVWIKVIETRGMKAEEVSKSRYEGLRSEMKGAIEYFRITEAGKEELISEEGYEKLAPEQRGTIKYYRRERPRLAEVEVWSLGDNIAFGTVERGGYIDCPPSHAGGEKLVDGFYATVSNLHVYMPEQNLDGFTVDLGAFFWIDDIRLILFDSGSSMSLSSRPSEAVLIHSLLVSDGSFKEFGESGWNEIIRRRATLEEWSRYMVMGEVGGQAAFIGIPGLYPLRYEIDLSSLRKIRYLKLRNITGMRESSLIVPISEVQIYGRGYPAEVDFLSPIIELPKLTNISSVEWEADVSAGTKLKVRVRTGDKLDVVKSYFRKGGQRITELEYNKLPGFMKEPVVTEFVPSKDWSMWQSQEVSGERIGVPSRKHYIQLEVKLLSDDPDQAATLKSITINYKPALVNKAKVRIEPNILEKGIGKPLEVSLTIKPSFTQDDLGFDRIMIVNPIKEVKDTRFRAPRLFKGEKELSEGTDYRMVSTEDDTLLFAFPKVMRKGDIDSLEVRFTTEIYWKTQVFYVYLGNSSLAGVWQSCEAENSPLVTDEIGMLSMGQRGMQNLELEPHVFTPNGDGINDVLEVRFDVLTVERAGVVVEIYDMSGRRLWRYREERPETAAGKYTLRWDGKDDSGRKVPPGLYVVKVYVERIGPVKVRSVGVAY